MRITACNSHESKRRGPAPLSGEMTTLLSRNIWFHLLAFFLSYCYLMAPLHLCAEADSQAVLEPSPAVLNDLLNLIPVRWSSSVLAPRFPGEDRAGKLGRAPSPPPPPPSLLFLSCSQCLLSSLLCRAPRGYRAPSSLSENPARPLFSARKSSLR